MDTHTQTLIIDSRLDATTEARQWIGQAAQQAGFGADTVFNVELAAGEALANVVRHAYQGEAGHEIHLAVSIDDEKLLLTIRDFGRKFDPDTYKPPDLDSPTEGGYGIFLMHELMDEVSYDTSLPDGTLLKLVKYRPGKPLDG
jgi:serine/threonine-protein kinase RsbW